MPKTKVVKKPSRKSPKVEVTFAYEDYHWVLERIRPKKHEDSFYEQWAQMWVLFYMTVEAEAVKE